MAWRQAIMWAIAGILLIRPLGTNFNEILIKIYYIFIQESTLENGSHFVSASMC